MKFAGAEMINEQSDKMAFNAIMNQTMSMSINKDKTKLNEVSSQATSYQELTKFLSTDGYW